MTGAPIHSTITLFTEIIISVLVFYIFYSGYTRKKFPYGLALFVILYETLFNISYMVSRAANSGNSISSGFEIGLAIFHGTLSLIMFITLIVFLVLAWKNYKKGINYFKKHRKLTATFIVLWSLSVLSGILFYFFEYIL